jgi:hypothetical protein
VVDENRGLIQPILLPIQTRLDRMEGRMTNIEVRMTAHEQHLGALLTGLRAVQDRTAAGWLSPER